MRTRSQHAQAAIELLERAEGEVACAAAADLGVPHDLVASAVMIRVVRELICRVFDVPDRGRRFPGDAP